MPRETFPRKAHEPTPRLSDQLFRGEVYFFPRRLDFPPLLRFRELDLVLFYPDREYRSQGWTFSVGRSTLD